MASVVVVVVSQSVYLSVILEMAVRISMKFSID